MLKVASAIMPYNARYCAFASGSEAQARTRLRRLKDKARIQRQANQPLNPGEKCELHFLTILYPPEIPALNANHEAFLERESIFSECPFDSDGFPIEYHRPVCPAPERVRAPEPEPDAEKDFQEFVVVPRFCTVDRELSAKDGRLVLKWMNKI